MTDKAINELMCSRDLQSLSSLQSINGHYIDLLSSAMPEMLILEQLMLGRNCQVPSRDSQMIGKGELLLGGPRGVNLEEI